MYTLAYLPAAANIINVIPRISSAEEVALTLFPIWSILGGIYYMLYPVILFLAKKESTIARTIYVQAAVTMLLFIAIGILSKQPMLIAVGLIIVLPSLFISLRVGILARLS